MTERFVMTREVLVDGGHSPHLQEAVEAGIVTPTPEDEREASRVRHLAAHPGHEDLFVFGFGSLMWNPACHVAGYHRALVRGWHRRFNLWTHIGRGNADFPGLALGLEPGGSVRGMALRIEAEKIESETRILWRREMLAGAYVPVWVRAELDGRVVPAVSFAINRAYVRYGNRIPFAVQARHIGCAEGPLGPCIEYLENTVSVLDSIGQTRGAMHDLLKVARQVRQRFHLECRRDQNMCEDASSERSERQHD